MTPILDWTKASALARLFGANTVARHARLGQLHISHLASYEHMGMLELELRAREPDAEISVYEEWRARWSGAEPCREHVAASDDWSTGELLATATVKPRRPRAEGARPQLRLGQRATPRVQNLRGNAPRQGRSSSPGAKLKCERNLIRSSVLI